MPIPELSFRLRPPRRRLQPRHLSSGRDSSAIPCPACGEGVRLDAHAVHYRGEAYHANCALYRRDGR